MKAILEAAAQLLERDGYAATTTDHIAERAGVSVGSLYQYFPNKDAILLALAACHGLEGLEAFAPLTREFFSDPPPLEEGLRRLVRTCVGLHSRPRLHQILFAETPFTPEMRHGLETAGEAVASGLAHYLAHAPGARVRDPKLAAHLLLASLTDLVHGFVIAPPAGYDMKRCEEELTTLLLRYLTGASEVTS